MSVHVQSCYCWRGGPAPPVNKHWLNLKSLICNFYVIPAGELFRVNAWLNWAVKIFGIITCFIFLNTKKKLNNARPRLRPRSKHPQHKRLVKSMQCVTFCDFFMVLLRSINAFMVICCLLQRCTTDTVCNLLFAATVYHGHLLKNFSIRKN